MPYFSSNDAHCIGQENKMEKEEMALWPHHDDTDDVDGRFCIGASACLQAGFDFDGLFPV
jgi:hypothetical protein